MSERDAITRASVPATRASLLTDLRALGVRAGMTLLVHTSLSELGWVSGGPVAVIQALMDAVASDGTLVMPAFTGDNSDPTDWRNPPVPPDWAPVIRESMPAYDAALSPARMMGSVAELFRTWPGVVRSAHPQSSFAAWGRDAESVTRGHSLEGSLGEGSPLARIYDRDGRVLLLGVGFGNNTSFHLGEFRAGSSPWRSTASAVMEDGQRIWRGFRDVNWNDDPFTEIGAAFEQAGEAKRGPVGAGVALLFPQRAAVDFAQRWLAARADGDD